MKRTGDVINDLDEPPARSVVPLGLPIGMSKCHRALIFVMVDRHGIPAPPACPACGALEPPLSHWAWLLLCGAVGYKAFDAAKRSAAALDADLRSRWVLKRELKARRKAELAAEREAEERREAGRLRTAAARDALERKRAAKAEADRLAFAAKQKSLEEKLRNERYAAESAEREAQYARERAAREESYARIGRASRKQVSPRN